MPIARQNNLSSLRKNKHVEGESKHLREHGNVKVGVYGGFSIDAYIAWATIENSS